MLMLLFNNMLFLGQYISRQGEAGNTPGSRQTLIRIDVFASSTWSKQTPFSQISIAVTNIRNCYWQKEQASHLVQHLELAAKNQC